jgi:type IV pilus assembly protein PilB
MMRRRQHREPNVGVVETLRPNDVTDTATTGGGAQLSPTLQNLEAANLRHRTLHPAVRALIPEAVARSREVVPVAMREHELLVAVAELTPGLQEELETVTGRSVQFLRAPHEDITWVLNRYYRAIDVVPELVSQFESSQEGKRVATIQSIDTDGSDAPIVRVVQEILTQAVRDRASDVHIEPTDEHVRVRFRIDGSLTEILHLPPAIGPGVVSRLKIMADMNIVERRRPQDGQFSVNLDGREIDVRVATVATLHGEKCVLRMLDSSRSVLTLDGLGMPPATHDTISRLLKSPSGMVLCAGPTGSGKTTTLYATLAEVNGSDTNVMTIEDPVEYVVPSINQVQTNEVTGLTFAAGLRAILRHDPDVILVGEIRDLETTRVAIQAALTGHFVASSVHATDAVAAISRLMDMGIEPYLVASSVVAVVGQRLVRRICTSCAQPYQPTDAELHYYLEGGGSPKETFLRGAGCNYCTQTGYLDRIGVYELLVMTPDVRRLVTSGTTPDDLRAHVTARGMRTLRQEATALVERDVTTIDEVIRRIYTA